MIMKLARIAIWSVFNCSTNISNFKIAKSDFSLPPPPDFSNCEVRSNMSFSVNKSGDNVMNKYI